MKPEAGLGRFPFATGFKEVCKDAEVCSFVVRPDSYMPFAISEEYPRDSSFVGNARPFVVVLLRGSCPSAVAWRVIPIRIDSVYGVVFCWAVPHVADKVVERESPSVAHGYSASTIHEIAHMAFMYASSDHPLPNLVDWSACHAVGRVFIGSNRIPNASARYGFSRSQGSSCHLSSGSAFALTVPVWISSFLASIRKHFPRAELLSSKINKSRINWDWYNRISHLLSSLKLMVRGSVVDATDFRHFNTVK